MSVPGTLFVSNLVCPPGSLREEEVQQTSEGTPSDDDFEFPPATETNIVEAAGNGAVTAVELVLNIGALLVAFISLKAATDGLLHSLGTNVGVPELSFELISSYIFWPLAWLLGTPTQDCAHVARLIGTKMAVNEFVAYESLGKLLGNDEGQGEIINANSRKGPSSLPPMLFAASRTSGPLVCSWLSSLHCAQAAKPFSPSW